MEYKVSKLKNDKELDIDVIEITNSNNFSTLYLKTDLKIKSGWYLFGVLHFGENRKCFGYFKKGLHGFSQGRPLYPSKRRWRVIHVNNSNKQIYLILENINKSIMFKEIWLIRIPFCDALRRVKNRLRLTDKMNYYKMSLPSHKLWKFYNNFVTN